jgi:hypothetical protein
MNSATQESASRDYDASGSEPSSLPSFNAEHTPVIRIEYESGNSTLYGLQVSVLF